MKDKGYTKEDLYKIKSVSDLMNMYIDSCSLRFIEQIDCSGDEDIFIEIIPQCAFVDAEGYFDEDLARKAFVI